MNGAMNDTLLRTYLDGWSQTCNSTPESVAAMLAGAHPDIRFSDVNSANVHQGHDGLRTICRLASGGYPDASIRYGDLLFDGTNWSIRWTLSGTRGDGSTFETRGASAGKVGEDGRVIEQTDYWNRGSVHGAG
jgi:hypothetical protein